MIQTSINIDGMTCGHCVETVTKALNGLSGVSEASVSLEEKRASLSYDEGVTRLSEIQKAVEDAGFEVQS